MEIKLLITVGDDPDSLFGVRFVSSFFRNKEHIKLTLLHVAPRFESMDTKEYLRVHEMDLILSEIYAKKGQQALETSERILLHQDFSSRRISTRLIHKRYGMFRDILEEARQGNYHAIVLGRRGYSIFEKILYPRLSEEVMDLDIDFPFWICRHPERGLKNVLLCIDGSESSLRAAEHVGFMMKREEEHGITLLHVDTENSRDVEMIMSAAKQKLLDHGIGEERIKRLLLDDPDVAGAFRREASRGSYAVVALGRHGIGSEWTSDKRFMGSKSLELLETMERSALWIIR